nr:hypothetical protein [Pyrinomonadaceae bacterium]
MTHTQSTQELKKSSGITTFGKLLKILTVLATAIFLVIFSSNVSAQPSDGSTSPQKTETGNKADQNLKSLARVNPSTLAMEFSLPLMSYPGRNGNSLPVGFNYSSKLWQMKSSVTWFYLSGSGTKRYLTDVNSKYGDRTSAGWTSMMMPPRIDESLEIYNQHGKPFSENLDDGIVVSIFENNLQAIIQGSIGNLIQPCGGYCVRWIQQCGENPQQGCNEEVCTGWIDNYCTIYTGGGSGSELPSQNLDRMHYIKRVRVTMSDGSSKEFRKSDKTFGYCAGENYPFNGANCEQTGEDSTGTFLAVDGSGMKLVRETTGNTLYMPNGSKYLFPTTAQNLGGILATSYFDADGNKMTFTQVPETSNSFEVNKWTDTLGREIVDALPYNWDSQKNPIGTFNANLPGLAGGTQDHKLKWLPLKPIECEESTDPNCGKVNGIVPAALEDQSQKLYYSNPKFCEGNLTTTLPVTEVLFTGFNTGHRSCNPFKMVDSGNTQIAVAARFNPTVLAEVELPNGKKYIFKYNRYGEISKIVYPTGSFETFEYDKVDSLAGYQSQLFDQTNRGVTERKVYNASGQLEQRWNYSSAPQDTLNPTSPLVITTIAPHKSDSTITNETGRAKSVRYLMRVPQPNPSAFYGNFGFDDPRAGMPLEERSYDENGALRSRSLTEYIVSPAETGADSRATRDPRPKRTISIMIEGTKALATLTELEYDTTGNNDREYFSALNVKQSKSYHYKSLTLTQADYTLETIAGYFSSDTPSAISETIYQYDANYKARGIGSLPFESRVLNPANPSDILAKTQTVFDESSYLVDDSGSLSGNLTTTWADPNTDFRAKPTTAKVWDKDTNTWIQTHTQFDQYGNVRKVWDASGDTTKFVETEYSSAYGFAYPTKVITPAPDLNDTTGASATSKVEMTYDLTTGLTLKVKDDFNQEIQTEYNDSLLRPTRVLGVAPFVIPIVETIYDDTALTVKVRKQIDDTNWNEATTYLDSFGRTKKTRAKDSNGDVVSETQYDLLSRVKQVSNPFRVDANGNPTETVYWTSSSFDELGRLKFVTSPDNAQVETQYDLATTGAEIGTVAIVIDQALKQ